MEKVYLTTVKITLRNAEQRVERFYVAVKSVNSTPDSRKKRAIKAAHEAIDNLEKAWGVKIPDNKRIINITDVKLEKYVLL